MAGAKHTPGPWRLLHDFPTAKNPGCRCAQVWADGWPVAFCDTRQDGEGYDSDAQMANARLIAAAPDLYAALDAAQRLCKEALPKFNWAGSALDANAIRLLNDVPLAINAALAKARGEG